MDPERWREQDARKAALLAQTEALADKLEVEGILARAAGNVAALDLVTGGSEPVNRFRSICFLPAIAQRDRRPMLNELRYFCENNRQQRRSLRYAVVTNGPRVRVPRREEMGDDLSDPSSISSWELRDRIRALRRRCSKFAYWARREFGMDVVLIAIEFTVKPEGVGGFSIHPHANLLYRPPVGTLPKRKFQRFLREAPGHLGGYWWKDCGRLAKPEEALKYPFKPAELDELDTAGIAWLFHQLFRLKLVTPVGSFNAWRDAELFEYGASGDPGAKQRARKVMTVYHPERPKLQLADLRRRGVRERSDSRNVGTAPMENLLIGITAPQRRHSPYAEPCALVLNPRQGIPSWDRLQAELQSHRERARADWDRNGAPDPQTALAVGRGQAGARAGEAGKVIPLSFTPVAQLSLESGCEQPARAPPDAEVLRLPAITAQRAYAHPTRKKHLPAGAHDDAIPTGS